MLRAVHFSKRFAKVKIKKRSRPAAKKIGQAPEPVATPTTKKPKSKIGEIEWISSDLQNYLFKNGKKSPKLLFPDLDSKPGAKTPIEGHVESLIDRENYAQIDEFIKHVEKQQKQFLIEKYSNEPGWSLYTANEIGHVEHNKIDYPDEEILYFYPLYLNITQKDLTNDSGSQIDKSQELLLRRPRYAFAFGKKGFY